MRATVTLTLSEAAAVAEESWSAQVRETILAHGIRPGECESGLKAYFAARRPERTREREKWEVESRRRKGRGNRRK
jgi:hypothetical protein